MSRLRTRVRCYRHDLLLTKMSLHASTASPMCGTSRYSSMTGRYPNRSSWARYRDEGYDMVDVHIPSAKLLDVESVAYGMDCSENNLAVILSRNGYRTGVVGKWHLTQPKDNYNYDAYRSQIRSCGFDYVEAIYAENLNNFWSDGTFSHNMEFLADKAEAFLRRKSDEPFFLYFNPTAPHDSGDMLDALRWFSCRDTPEGWLSSDPMVTGMTADYGGCAAYRESIFDRAKGSTDSNVLGSIWVDDAIGALFQILEDIGELDNTFFLFQLDHGKEGKGSLYEPGVRVARFIHYPAVFGTRAREWDGLMSTVDIAPTILDFADIDEMSPGYYSSTLSLSVAAIWNGKRIIYYSHDFVLSWFTVDGISVKQALQYDTEKPFWMNRCLVFELDYDRAIRCGCYKYMALDTHESSRTMRKGDRVGVAVDNELLFNLCADSRGRSVSAPGRSPETSDEKWTYPSMLDELRGLYEDHLADTHP